MPAFEVKDGRTGKPTVLRQRAAEARIEELLVRYPRLLGHVSESKPRRIIWFWKRPNGPGDLFGFDDRGRLVIVEVKKRFGVGYETKSAKQLRAAARRARQLTRAEIREARESLLRRYRLAEAPDSPRLDRLIERRFRSRLATPYLYAVAGHFTGAGRKSATRKSRRRRRLIHVVILFEVRLGDRRSVIMTERLHSFIKTV